MKSALQMVVMLGLGLSACNGSGDNQSTVDAAIADAQSDAQVEVDAAPLYLCNPAASDATDVCGNERPYCCFFCLECADTCSAAVPADADHCTELPTDTNAVGPVDCSVPSICESANPFCCAIGDPANGYCVDHELLGWTCAVDGSPGQAGSVAD